MKRTRSQSTKAGSSQKKSRWEPVAEAPSKGISTSRVDPEPIHAGSKEDEDFEIPLRPNKGLVVVTIEELS